MSSYKVRLSLIVEIAICILCYVIIILTHGQLSIIALCRYSLVISVVLLIVIRVHMHNWLNPVIVLFVSFCLFQFGQYYLFALNIPYDYYFTHSYYTGFFGGEIIIEQSIEYSILCLCAFAIGLSMSKRCEKKGVTVETSNNKSDDEGLKKTGQLLFFISVPFAFIYAGIMLYIAINYGYHGIRNGAGAVLLEQFTIINRMTQFFVPSVLLLRIYYRNTKKEKLFDAIIITYSIIYIIVGQRTICMALILTYLLLIKITKKNYNRRNAIVLTIGLIAIMVLSSYIAETRSTSSRAFEIQSLISPIVDFVGECGWTGFILPVIMTACPIIIPYAYGKAYLASISGFFPTFIDPTGTLAMLSNYCSDMWVTNYLGFSWGVGYSLIGESYYNFSWFGVVPILLIALIIGYFINSFDLESFDEQPLFKQYVVIVLLYELITLPRRGVFNFFNILFYDVFIFYIGMILLKNRKKKA